MANKLFQAFIDTAKTIAGYPITVANAVFMRDGSTLDEFSENIPHREDNEDTNIEVPNIDADMLNGHPADYYAKQSDLSALNNSVTQVNNKIGNTDISKWGNSLTGAIKAACDKSDANEVAIADVNSNLDDINNSLSNSNSFIQITKNQYVAEKDCILKYDISTSATIYSGGSVTVNGLAIASLYSNVANVITEFSGCWRLRKNDYVELSSKDGATVLLYHN